MAPRCSQPILVWSEVRIQPIWRSQVQEVYQRRIFLSASLRVIMACLWLIKKMQMFNSKSKNVTIEILHKVGHLSWHYLLLMHLTISRNLRTQLELNNLWRSKVLRAAQLPSLYFLAQHRQISSRLIPAHSIMSRQLPVSKTSKIIQIQCKRKPFYSHSSHKHQNQSNRW